MSSRCVASPATYSRSASVNPKSSRTGGRSSFIRVRIVSLHFVDKLLFSGPLHLNWLLDIGATFVVAFCALTYARVAGRGRPARGTREE